MNFCSDCPHDGRCIDNCHKLASSVPPWSLEAEAHWREMAEDTVNQFWFTNREARIMFAEIDRLRALLEKSKT